jgi:hypothetical protein
VVVKPLTVGAMFVTLAVSAAAQGPRYGVKASVDKHTDFTKLRTYTWTTGWSAFDPAVDRTVIGAVDRQLAARGLVRLEAEPSDVLVSYASVQRSDVEVKSKLSSRPRELREYPAGTLVVRLLEPATRRELFRAKGDAPLGADPAAVARQIDALVSKMFDKYPGRRRNGR